MERVLNLEESVSTMQVSILQRLSALEAREAAPHQPQLSMELAETTKRLSALEADIVALNLQGLERRAADVEAGAGGHCQRFVRGTCQTSAKLDVSWKADAKTEVFQELQGVFSEASSDLDDILQRCGNQKVVHGSLVSKDMQPPSSQVSLSDSSGQISTTATESEEHAHPLNNYVMGKENQTKCSANYSREEVKQALIAEMHEAVRAVVHNALQALRRSEEELIVERTQKLLATTRISLERLQADFEDRFEEVEKTLRRQIEAFFEQRLESGQMKNVVVPGKVLPLQHDVPPAFAHCQAMPVVHDLATPPSSPRSSAPSSTSLSSYGEPLGFANPVDEGPRRQPPACVPRLCLPPSLYEPCAGICYKEREQPLPPLLWTARTKDPSFTQAGSHRPPSAGRSLLESGRLSGGAGSRRATPTSSWQRALRRALI